MSLVLPSGVHMWERDCIGACSSQAAPSGCFQSPDPSAHHWGLWLKGLVVMLQLGSWVWNTVLQGNTSGMCVCVYRLLAKKIISQALETWDCASLWRKCGVFTKAVKKAMSWVVEAWAVVMIWRSWCKFCKLDCEQISWEDNAEFDSNRACSWQVFLSLKYRQIKGNFCCLMHIRFL